LLGRMTEPERESMGRVLACLEREADGACGARFRALWRRLAANLRREMSED
jgi:hypothetical protein